MLIRALHFAERLHKFETSVQGFASSSNSAAELAYSHARLLLELGHENSEALDKAFSLFFKCSLQVSSLLDRSELLAVTSEVQEQLCLMYTDLVTLVVEVAIYFYKTVQSLGESESAVGLDLFETFGENLHAFTTRKNKVSSAIWSYQIASQTEEADDVLSIDQLSDWLAPQDRLLDTLSGDHTFITDQLSEITGSWFQDTLVDFIKGSNECLLLKGAPGAGKTTLAAALTERLQRPVARQNLSTVFVTIGAIPAQATSIHVVKSILYQLLNSRIGNLGLYRALVTAYNDAHITADVEAYETSLWSALVEILQRPMDGANNTVLVIDGLEELQGGETAGQQLLERLTRSVGRGKRTKLIAFSQSLPLPSGARGQQRSINPEDTRDEVHNVALRALAHSRVFIKKQGPEQESIVASIMNAAQGSFLWTILVCEILKAESSPEGFTKNLQAFTTQNVGVPDLVLRLLTTLQPSHEATLLLSWLTVAARPLTMPELSDLLAVKPETGELVGSPHQVSSIVEAIRPLLSVNRDIVSIKHSSVTTSLQKTLQTLVDQGKLTVPHKNRQVDMLIRSLVFAKAVLPKITTPSLDDSDFSLPARLFPKHPLLEYVIRYWPSHFEQTPFNPTGNAAPKIPDDVRKTFPSTTAMPLLEWLCWHEQFPSSRIITLHTTLGRLRQEIFTENHPVVMQSYINSATSYVPVGNDREASKYYFLATIIGQTVLSPTSPVTIECGNRFLSYSSGMTTTKRTDIMTQRERVLKILITSYERVHGMTSEVVVTMRQQLIDLYMYIHEEEHANELLHKHEEEGGSRDLGQTNGTRGPSDHYRPNVHRKTSGTLDSYEHKIFDKDIDEEQETDLDLTGVDGWLQKIRTYQSSNKHEEAEEAYIELWRQLSTICRKTQSTEWHERKLETVNSYAAFLQSQKRSSETSAILTTIAAEYRQHQLSYSESVIAQLTKSARTLRAVGHSSAALSIFKQASAFYSSTRSQQSQERSFTEIEEEIRMASEEVIKQATTEKKSSEVTSSSSSLLSVFQSLISNKTKTVDAQTVTVASQLTTQYMEEHRYEEAIEIVNSTLSRTWSSFMAESLHSVNMSTSFLQENLTLIEQLVQAYLAQRKIEKAIDIWHRLFRAALSSPQQHKDLLEKSKRVLIDGYDKYGYPDRSIATLQEVRAVYTRVYGPSHELTISTLYELGSRCRRHARTHPYWIEYYQEIVTIMTKETREASGKTFEAAVIVANTFWEERRFVDAVTMFSLIWATFITKEKRAQHKELSETTFVQNLFDRYRQSLEMTQASEEQLYQVAKQYRETCAVAFGANASITSAARMAYVEICRSSEKHETEALQALEESSKQSGSSMSASEKRETKRQMAAIYRRRIMHSSSVSSETVEQARSMYQEQLTENRSAYGYTHESTLESLREVSMLSFRQSKEEEAMKAVSTAVNEIAISKASHEAVMQAASSIASIFHSSKQTKRANELVSELRWQLMTREKRSGSRYNFDLTNASSSSLNFLAALEYNLRTDMSLTYSDIFAELLAERMYYANFMKIYKSATLDKIVIAAAPLRHFLLKRGRTEQAQQLEQQVVGQFVQRDLSDFALENKKTSPTTFIVGLLDFLGARKRADFIRAVLLGTNITLRKLVDGNRFAEAYDVAHIGFTYAKVHKGYKGPGAISCGFELAAYMDGRGENRCPDERLRKKLLELANHVVKEILAVCREQKINLAQVQLSELNELIAMLGEQGDYETLEPLLTSLWNTREAQANWPSDALINLGQRLICARYLAGHPIKAIRLCEDIAYNLRRAHGVTHPATMSAYKILAQLYTSTAQMYQKNAASDKSAASLASDYFKRAVLMEEDVLRWLVNAGKSGAESQSDEEDTAAAILAEHGVQVDGVEPQSEEEESVDRSAAVKHHLQLLKLAYQRFGQWPKPYGAYEALNADIFKLYGEGLKGVEGVEKWQAKGFGGGKAESGEGAFAPPQQWDILVN